MNKKITLKDLRVFGIIWGLIFAFFSYKSSGLFSNALGIISLAALGVAAICPDLFLQSGLYKSWIKIGDFVGKINSFLIISILFYLIFTPIGIVLRLLKKDLLSKSLNSASKSYFIDRKTQPGSIKNQF